MKKLVSIVLVMIMTTSFAGCVDKSTQTGNDFITDSTPKETEQQVQETTSTPSATENTNMTNYYAQLLENDTQAKQDAETKRNSDLELADLMLRECTKKLSNCTIELFATTKYKCGDIDKQFIYGSTPTDGVYEVATRLCFTDEGLQLATRQEKSLYRDTTLLDSAALSLTAQATATDDWSDKMNFLLYHTIDYEGETGIPVDTIQDSFTKGEIYKYISRDVRSSLNRFLSIDVDNITEEDGTYIIKGKTKDIFVIVDEMGGNAILNNQTWVNNKGQKNAGLMNTTGILVKHKVDVTLYIDKATETLTAIEAKSENSLNEEETTMQGVIINVGSTEIEPYDAPEALINRSISDVDTINKAITYSR